MYVVARLFEALTFRCNIVFACAFVMLLLMPLFRHRHDATRRLAERRPAAGHQTACFSVRATCKYN